MLRRPCPVRGLHTMAIPLTALAILVAAAVSAAPLDLTWQCQQKKDGAWAPDGPASSTDDTGVVLLDRTAAFHLRHSTTIDWDPGATSCIEVDALTATTQWRLTAQNRYGPEILIADSQVIGVCRRNVAQRLEARDAGELALRIYLWGWGTEPRQYLRCRVSLLPECEETDAGVLVGDMAAGDARVAGLAEKLTRHLEGHPRLRFTAANRATWQQRFATTHASYAHPVSEIIADIEALKAAEPWELTPDTYKSQRPAWGSGLLSVRPPPPPELRPGEGRDPFPGMWRDLNWHDYSLWLLGACISDDPVFVEQAARFAVTPVQWRFWLAPDYHYFDFDSSYPLQCLCFAYDVAFDAMTDAEREEVRAAIATIAHGLYLNTLSGHGSIYNDLRGNHTAVTMCGLGVAGLTLLGEHPEAPKWVALAEKFMVDAFNEHTSGGWLESPSYGAYGVCEWLKLAEMLNNVTGHNHLTDDFLRRFAEYQLHVSDWEGRDLGYNGGGAGEYWDQWVFFAIARAFKDERFQWLGQCLLDTSPTHSGYGDLFWWIDASITPRRPTETNTGRTFADIGVNVWRTGWDENATILLHHCGPKGQHKEQNMNQVTLYALGQRILPDGLGSGTVHHNVPMVDEKPQNLYYPGQTRAYHSDGVCGYSVGEHPGYYAAERRVLYLRPDIIVLLDTLRVGDRGDHTIAYRLHARGDATVEGNVATVTSGPAALRILTLLDDGTQLPVSLTTEGEQKGITLYSAAHTGRGTIRAATVVLISPADQVQPVESAAGDGRIRITAGDKQYVLGLTPGEITAGFSTTAPLWLASLSEDGPRRIMACGDAVMGHSALQLRTPDGMAGGGTCVSWGEAR